MATQIPIEVVIKALNLTQPEIEKVKRELEVFKQSQKQTLGSHSDEIQRARGAAELLGQTFGIHIPRELRSLMASTQLVGGAMALAFGPAAILALLPIVSDLASKIGEIAEKFDDSASKARDFGAAATKSLHDATEAAKGFRDATREGDLIGLDPQQAALRKSQFKREEAGALDPQIQFSRLELAALRKEQEEFARRAAQTAPSPMVGLGTSAPSSAPGREEVARNAKAIEVVEREINTLLDRQRTLLKEADNAWQGYKQIGTVASQSVAAATDTANKDVAAMMANLGKFEDSKFDQQIRAIDEAILKAEQVQRAHPEAYSLANEVIGRLMAERAEIVRASNNAIVDSMRLTDTQMLRSLDALMGDLVKEKQKYLPANPIGSGSGDGIDKFTGRLQTIKNISEEIGRSFDSVFAAMITHSTSAGDAVVRMFQSIAMAAMAAVIKMTLVAQIERAIGGIFAPAGVTAAQASSVSTQSLGSLYSFPGMASGGPVSANMPYLIGERGPELFVPGSSGSVVPNGKFGGGAAPSVVINNNTGTPMETSQPRFDGEKWWVDIFTKQMMTNGPVRQMLKGR
jgi:hypothetical protein